MKVYINCIKYILIKNYIYQMKRARVRDLCIGADSRVLDQMARTLCKPGLVLGMTLY